MTTTEGLALLRQPFPPHQISKLPKPTKQQTEEVKRDFTKGIRCELCGTWHHPKVVHLDYVGHAALTYRLLDADPNWTWEPLAMSPDGLPVFDGFGGMWIKLTVCGITRLGYGAAEGKDGPNAIKEVIGDALRNAAMRFGAALDLWHKGDLHADDDADDSKDDKRAKWLEAQKVAIFGADTVGTLKSVLTSAINVALRENDSAAVDQLNTWAEQKRATAKVAAEAS